MERHRANIILYIAVISLIIASSLYIISGGCTGNDIKPLEAGNSREIFSGPVGKTDAVTPGPPCILTEGDLSGDSPSPAMSSKQTADVTPLSGTDVQPALPSPPDGGEALGFPAWDDSPLVYDQAEIYFWSVNSYRTVRREVEGSPRHHLASVMLLLLEGPTEEEATQGYKTYIPEGTTLATIGESYDGTWCVIYLSSDFCSLAGHPHEASIALGQVRETMIAAKPSLQWVDVGIYYFDKGSWESDIYRALDLKSTGTDYLKRPIPNQGVSGDQAIIWLEGKQP